jgi:hypothetical protein
MDIAQLTRNIETHSGEIVLRYVDSGRECQFWFFPGDAAALEEWWKSQETFNPIPTEDVIELYKAFGEAPPTGGRTEPIPGEFVDADSPEKLDLWTSLSDRKTHYFCELCCDTDSYLRRPDDKTHIYHRGYKS